MLLSFSLVPKLRAGDLFNHLSVRPQGLALNREDDDHTTCGSSVSG
jgi:hypothetical protein